MARGGLITLLPATPITEALTGTTGQTCPTHGLRDLLVEANFVYGSGGTSCTAWVQVRIKGGTWRDIMTFAFTTSSATLWSKCSISTALAAAHVASDAALGDNAILDGFLGDQLRVKLTTVGTYADGTSLHVIASGKY